MLHVLAKRSVAKKFIIVSSVGADSKSKTFYLKLKGELEDAIHAIGLDTVHIMRPSMLLGERKDFRLGEKIGKGIIPAISFLLPSKYKPIHAMKVAKAMLAAAKKNKEGFFVYEYQEIKKLSG